MYKLVHLVLSSLLLCCLCSKEKDAAEGKLIIVTSIFPIYDISRNIAGDDAAVKFIIPAGANPHTYEPVPSSIKMIREARIFIGLHRDFDGWITKFLDTKATVAFLLQHPDTSHEPGSRVEDNPHIWLSLKGAENIAGTVAQILTKNNPPGGGRYAKNLEAYREELKQCSRTIAGLFADKQGGKFIQWHRAWDYFARDYGLIISGTIEEGHGAKPSVKSFKELAEKSQREGTKVIVVGLNMQSKEAESLAEEIGGTIVRMDSIGDPDAEERSSYCRLMLFNARALARALK